MMRILPLLLLLLCFALPAWAENREFSRCSVDLPEGWDGEERSGFSTGHEDEYMLSLGKKDSGQDKYLAQVSLFILPNKEQQSAEDFANKMAALQENVSDFRKEGLFWTFQGETRSQIIKAPALTRVNADAQRVLIIMSQDPQKLGAEAVVAGLKGLGEDVKALLGR